MTMPASVELERAVLGAAMFDADAEVAISVLDAEDFSELANRMIFNAASALRKASVRLDPLRLHAELQHRGQDRLIGGMAYLISLADDLPDPARVPQYVASLRAFRQRRDVHKTCVDLSRVAIDLGTSADEALGLLRYHLQRIEALEPGVGIAHWRQAVTSTAAELEQRRGGGPLGLSTGFYDLDRTLQGIEPGEIVIVAGRPSMGKSCFAQAIALHVGVRKQRPTAWYSLEMTRKAISMRILSAEARVKHQALRGGYASKHEMQLVKEAAARLAEAPLYIDDSPLLTTRELAARARATKKRTGDLGLIVLDYLNLLSPGHRGESRNYEVAEMSRDLKRIAGELLVPIIVVQQLNRGPESRTDKRPMLSDLRDSGAVEQDADTVLMLYRDEYYNRESPDRGTAEVIVAKNRNGETNMVRVKANLETMRFESLDERHG